MKNPPGQSARSRRLRGKMRAALRSVTSGACVASLALLCVLLPPLMDAQRFEARLLDQDENFASLDVTALAQDQSGHLWIAAQSAVLIYDGSRFHAFGREDGLTDPTAFSLLVDSSGTVWAGGHGGLFWFDGQRFHELLSHGESLHIGVNSMLASSREGEIVARTPREVYSIMRSKTAGQWDVETYWQRHPAFKSDKDWNGLGFDANGRLVMGCDEALCVFEEDRLRILGPAEGVAPDYYVSLFRARDGVLWARGRKHIVALRPGDSSAKEVGDLLPAGALTTIHRRFTEDAAGNILTPTALGFATWDGTTWIETRSTSQGTLGGASEVLCDREGSVWIGTDGAGLLESRGYRAWANYGREQGFRSPGVSAIQKDLAGTIWFATTQDIMLLKRGETALSESPLKGEPDSEDVVSLVASPDGGMWAGTQLGAIKHVTAHGSIDVRASIDAYIQRMRLAADGVLWIGTTNGIFTLHCAAGMSKPCAAQPLAVDGLLRASVRDFIVDPDGNPWLADDNGLVQIRDGHARRFPVLGIDHLPIHGRIDLLARDGSGGLWVGRTNLELLHVRLLGDHGESLERYAKPQLPSVTFSFLETVPDGSLWFGTDRGIGKIDNAAVNLANYDDGLIWNTTDERAFFAESDGTVWVGTTQGASHLLRQSDAFTRSSFPAEVRSIEYDGSPVEVGGSLPWTGGVTIVDFAGLTLRGNRSLLYSYRLQGFDDQVISTRTPFARFQKLPPGGYVFHVVAQDAVHNVYSAPAEVAFTLLPPWWRTWWFKCLYALIAVLLLMGLWHLSHLALLAQRRKLQRLVAERTSKLEYMVVRDGLTGLLNRNAILERLSTEIERVQRSTQKASKRGEKTSAKSFCVSLIDLDHFKRINDTHGHLAGDTVLREAARRLENAVRATDCIGRYGGEEFIVLFTDIERDPGIERCEMMRQALSSQPVMHEGVALNVTCSIGLTGWMGEGDSLTEMIARADRAMYTAKSSGRNRVEFAA